MKIHWWKPPYPPELADYSAEEKKRIWRECHNEVFRNKTIWLVIIVCGSCAGIGSYIGDITSIGKWGAAIGGGLGGFLASQISTSSTIKVIKKRYPIPVNSVEMT